MGVDDTVPELPVKDVVFRIHRDVRFSKDATSYEPCLAAAWSRTGRKGPYACYYVHCEPAAGSGCFVGGGLWQPEAGALARLWCCIDRQPGRWRRVLAAEPLRSVFLARGGGGGYDDDGALVRCFFGANQEGALKRRPMVRFEPLTKHDVVVFDLARARASQGYSADHRDIALLKLRSFTLRTELPAASL